MSSALSRAFLPITLNQLRLKNRFIKTATFEGMTPDGVPTQSLVDFHADIAEGGVGLTTVAYGGVNNQGRTHEHQMLMNEKAAPMLQRLTAAVHAKEGAASIQLTHCGYFSSNRTWKGRPVSPSRTINYYGLLSGKGLSKAMTEEELIETEESFVKAARLSQEVGFDAIEIHLGHGYLLSQFLSPFSNSRTDVYGGELRNRVRFPLQVLRAVRTAVGKNFPILVKLNLSDGQEGGWKLEDTLQFVPMLEGLIDAVVLSGGVTSKNAFYLLRGDVPRREMAAVQENIGTRLAMQVFGKFLMKSYAFTENFFHEDALKVRKTTNIPLVYLGGICSGEGVGKAMEQFDMVAIGRALIHDPGFLQKLNNAYASPCNHCNRCLVEMDVSGVRCVLNE